MTHIFITQNNYRIGDFEGNTQKILASIEQAKKHHCSLVITSELALTGYPPKDLLCYQAFIEEHQSYLKKITAATSNITLLLGAIRKNTSTGNSLFNSCLIIRNGEIVHHYDKWLLPSYDVFNEKRYFAEGRDVKIFEHEGKKIALTICEDIWFDEVNELYHNNPILEIAKEKPDLLINLSASPFELHKLYKRIRLAQSVSSIIHCPVIYANQVGANDHLIFDGYSFVADANHLLAIAKGFEEDSLVIDTNSMKAIAPPPYLDPAQLYKALTLGIRDYFHKQRFSSALIGLSGGIDSALVAALTAEALGPQNVWTIAMPSRFSSDHSVIDAEKLAKNLGVHFSKVPIESIHSSYLELLTEPFKGRDLGITEENLQSRIRGMILMAFSNRFNHLVIGCGNKSELAMGYATLYGDLLGGLTAISDITKTQVYEIAHWINRKHEIIPQSIIEKAPSAELRPNQKDSDTLPDYAILDSVIIDYVDHHLSPQEIVKKRGIELNLVHQIISQIHQSEYKRRQAPTGLKVSPQAFSSGWQMPIVTPYRPQ